MKRRDIMKLSIEKRTAVGVVLLYIVLTLLFLFFCMNTNLIIDPMEGITQYYTTPDDSISEYVDQMREMVQE